MTARLYPRLGAASGALSALVLFAGSGHTSPGEVVREIAALVLFLPFLAYFCSLLREAEGEGHWLTTTALAAGIAATSIKIATGMPILAINHAPQGTPLHNALNNMASASSAISLYPLALMLAAIAVLTLRTKLLPRWLSIAAALAATAAATYAVYTSLNINANFGPALLLYALWTLTTSITLLRNARRRTTQQPQTEATVTA
jgi:hypothetical protein